MLTQNIPLNILIAACVGFFVAGALKILIHYLSTGKVEFYMAFTTGGMPSSHSSTVGALATSVLLIEGFTTTFVIALFFALIVMIDAIGVRYETGKQGRVLNKLMRRHHIPGERFNESVGHTPLQVLVGVSLGIGIAVLFFFLSV
jgi:acid phosphatase family membrane protein YuiD